jgi:predicted transcriptional regulator
MYRTAFKFGNQKINVMTDSLSQGGAWTFLTNHAHVVICLFENPSLRVRDVAVMVGITERAVQKIISELEAGGILQRERQGRRNVYQIRTDRPLRHPVEAHCTVADLIGFVLAAKPKDSGVEG